MFSSWIRQAISMSLIQYGLFKTIKTGVFLPSGDLLAFVSLCKRFAEHVGNSCFLVILKVRVHFIKEE